MKLKAIAAGIGLGVFASVAQAEFMFELEGALASGSGTYENDDYSDVDTDTTTESLAATVYFGKVSSGGVPYREAAFLSHRSSLTLTRVTQEVEYSETGYEDMTVKTSANGLFGRVVIPGPNLILLLGMQKGEFDDSDVDVDTRVLGVGVYVNPRGALTLTHAVTEYDFGGDTEDETTTSLDFRQVNPAGSRGQLVYHFNLGRSDDGDRYDETDFGGGVFWYVNQKFGFGAELQFASGSDDYSDTFTATFTPSVSFDFNENVGLYATLDSTAATNESDYDGDTDYSYLEFTAGVNIRF